MGMEWNGWNGMEWNNGRNGERNGLGFRMEEKIGLGKVMGGLLSGVCLR